ncbi:MAG: hypothetical protein JW927_18445 [Deltaproteobacteria bacterium]|nr:hypothetical protein [Deltaproteobacteria bacterium]
MQGIEGIYMIYEEWRINSDSLPGWEIAPKIIDSIIRMPDPFKGWVYENGIEGNHYSKIEEFDDGNKYRYSSALNKFIKRNALCMVKTVKIPMERLIKEYSKTFTGVIDKIENNMVNQIFSAPLEIGDWALIKENEMVLIVCHDGDPLFILKNKDA